MSDSDHSHEWDTAQKDLMSLVDTTVPVSARIWNYWLGGKDYYQVDKEAGDQFLAQYPGIAHVARAGRLFISRTVTYLVRDAGVRQFLDIGTGLPTEDNTHEVAQRQQIHRLFDGLNPVEPGIVPIQQWRPDEKSAALTQDIHACGGIGQKP